MPRSRKRFIHTPRTNQSGGPWIWCGKRTGGRRRCICVTSPVQMTAALGPRSWRCTLLIKLCQIGRSWQPLVICFPGSHWVVVCVCVWRWGGGEGGDHLFSHQALTETLGGQTPPQRHKPQCLKGLQHAEMLSARQSAFAMRTFPDGASFCCREPPP